MDLIDVRLENNGDVCMSYTIIDQDDYNKYDDQQKLKSNDNVHVNIIISLFK